jgi:hypothetical protein
LRVIARWNSDLEVDTGLIATKVKKIFLFSKQIEVEYKKLNAVKHLYSKWKLLMPDNECPKGQVAFGLR